MPRSAGRNREHLGIIPHSAGPVGCCSAAPCPGGCSPQVALSSCQRQGYASGSSRSACSRITTSRTSHRLRGSYLQPPLRALAQHPATLIEPDREAASSQERPAPVCARCYSSSHSPSHCYYHHPQLSRIVANHTSTVTASTRPHTIQIWSPSRMTLWPLWSRRPRPAHP